MLFYSDAEPLSICAVIGPDHTHCVQIGFELYMDLCNPALAFCVGLRLTAKGGLRSDEEQYFRAIA